MGREQEALYEHICKTSDLTEIQRYIDRVIGLRGFGGQSPQEKLLLLTEEIGELAKAVRRYATSMTLDYDKIQNYDTVESEIADVFIVLLSLCNTMQIDVYRALLEKEKKNIGRRWQRRE